MKTFIRWQGNKSKHINKFIQYIPDFDGTYIEPFVGSGALFLRLQPQKWIINDLNKDLVNVWNTVMKEPVTIERRFKKFGNFFTKMDKKTQTDYCRKITHSISDMKYTSKRATTFLLMKYCAFSDIVKNNKFYFSGLDIYIYKKNCYSFLNKLFFENIHNISKFLNSGKIYNKSYEEILKKAKKGDFVFLDRAI